MNKYTIRDIAELGIFAGITIVLSLPIFKIHIAPDAGSISFVMIPLFILAIRHTWWKTLIVCAIVYGLPACLINGHGLQGYPLDYMCAYGSIAIVSLFRGHILSNKKSSYLFLILSITIVTLLRYAFSTMSSIWIYEYQFIAALIYNATYIFISGAIGLVALLLLLKPLKIVDKKYPCVKELQ